MHHFLDTVLLKKRVTKKRSGSVRSRAAFGAVADENSRIGAPRAR